ncbi:MAG TPA: hypothetical protein VFA77_08130, partial [Candidatus Eisenbacteria bacterium]|nr:hypothetical protein [Candidatus Eisenbacteria bacterium]
MIVCAVTARCEPGRFALRVWAPQMDFLAAQEDSARVRRKDKSRNAIESLRFCLPYSDLPKG